MKKTFYFSFVAILILMGCSKSDDLGINPDENQLKTAKTATALYTWDNTSELQTALWPPLVSYTSPPGYPEYIASNYDVMAHFQYFSPKALSGAVVEFTFPHILDFVPHFIPGQKSYTYSVNNTDNITVISCTTDLLAGRNDMFCFMVKVDCSKGTNGLTTFGTDMKVNDVSVKGTIKNKVFACN